MKRMRIHLILMTTFIVLTASLISIPISILITKTFFDAGKRDLVVLGLTLREVITPILIIIFYNVLFILASRRAISPFVELSDATKQIAAGNFDISIGSKHKKGGAKRLANDFNLMAQELKANEYLRKDFISNVSHEFKTPLSIISGYAELLDGDEILDNDRHEYSVTIQKESKRLIKLTGDLLSLSRLDHQKIQEKAVPFRLDEQIRQAVLLLSPEWSAKNISMDVDIPNLVYVGNEALLAQVWSNLLDNAIKFTGEEGLVCIWARAQNGVVTVKISDNGEGMSEQTQARIFEQFYQGDSSHAAEGHGLGLALVKKILDVSGGSISVTSKIGYGTNFVITLPITE
ncbi:MAG: HAMP domain-containing sensor histidine kinase [Oscillospiraceae bacterium]